MIDIGIGIQARLSSSRLPAKVLLELNGQSILKYLIRSCLLTNLPVYLLTSSKKEDDLIIDEIENEKNIAGVFRGSIVNVRSRYMHLAEKYNLKSIIRVTADNPFTDTSLFEKFIQKMKTSDCDYITGNPKLVLEGMNSEYFTVEALRNSISCSSEGNDVEHVTPWIKKNQKISFVDPDYQINDWVKFKEIVHKKTITIDTLDEYVNSRKILKGIDLKNGEIASMNKIINCIISNEEWDLSEKKYA